jgi:ATP-binding cassette subfamily B protein RaxB
MTLAARRWFTGARQVPLVIQSANAECGLACLAMVAAYHGHEIDLIALRRRFPVSARGLTLKALFQLGQHLEMVTRGVRIEPVDAGGLQLPAILHWDNSHFVVLTSVGARSVVINDPALGIRRYDWKDFKAHFTGFALELCPSKAFEVKREVRKLRLWDLCGSIGEIRSLAIQTTILSVLLQLFTVISPLFIKLVVDEVASTGDDSALLSLALGFGVLAILNATVDYLRTLVLTNTGGMISYRLVTNLFYHFVRLPLPWFEQRHIGDMASRFASTEPIKKFVTEGLTASLVDGTMVGILLIALLLCDTRLAAIVVGFFVLRSSLRFATLAAAKRRGEAVIREEAREHSAFVETAIAIQSIKIAGREAERQSFWQNRYASALQARLQSNQFQSAVALFANATAAIENVLVIYVAITLNLAGDLSLGLLFTFLAYRQQFVDKGTKLLEAFQELRLLDLHFDRVADIALNEREKLTADDAFVAKTIDGAVTLCDVRFKFAAYEEELLRGVDLAVAAGEFVAITGPSGGGKTTLMKVMLGFFEPTSGSVAIDGQPLGKLGLAVFRSQIGVVLQDDHLLSGTIADNICFFDSEIDIEWMRECTTTAGIDAEVMAMPMNYNTIVGGLGVTLSGGQRQRILLARALYRRPKILFLDEGTSHLDVERERQVNKALSQLSITRIIIAHRPETIRAADRIVALSEGRLVPHPMPPSGVSMPSAWAV